MPSLSTPINLDIAKFFRWWGSELAYFVPETLRKLLQRKRSCIVLLKSGDSYQANYVNGIGEQDLGSFSLDEEGIRKRNELLASKPELTHAELRLHLLPGQCLQKTVKLPAAAEENLRQVIGFELDRLTPFKADQVYYDVRVLERLAETRQVKVGLALSPRDKLDLTLNELIGLELRPTVVDVGGAFQGNGYNLLPDQFRVKESRWPKIILIATAGLLLMTLIATLLLPLLMKRELIAKLEQDVKRVTKTATEVEELKTQAEKLQHENGFLVRKKKEEPAMVDLLENLTQVIPDQTWLNGLQFHDRKVVLQGQSPAASSLIERIEASPYFKNTSFVSPVTKDVGSGHERFQISIDVLNGRYSENPVQ